MASSLPSRGKSPEPGVLSSHASAETPDTRPSVDSMSKKPGPRLSFAAPPLVRNDSKRSSIQFDAPPVRPSTGDETQAAPFRPKLLNRASSPPPQRTYARGVCFDTFDNRDATDFSLTLNYKHKNYQHTRRSRTFLCGTDQKDYSEFALEWLIDELVDDGDEIVCLRVVEKDSKLVTEGSMDQRKYHEEGEKLLNQVIHKNTQDEKAISLVLELAVGKIQDIIQRMIQIYEPAVLIVGTRGRSLNGMQGLLPGSVSKYCLQQSPIPVIVVRPSNKRMKKKKKRQADPTRRDYNQILTQSEAAGSGHLLEKSVRDSMIGPLPTATDDEAAAVARAIGISKERLDYDSRLARTISARTDATASDGETDPSPEPSPPIMNEDGTDDRVLKSPNLKPKKLKDRDISPAVSANSADEESSSDEGIKDMGGSKNPFILPKRKPGKKKKKKTPSEQAGHAVGAVVEEIVPRRSNEDNDRGGQILDLLEELTG